MKKLLTIISAVLLTFNLVPIQMHAQNLKPVTVDVKVEVEYMQSEARR